MEYIKLGQTGLSVSKLCLGCMSFGDASKGFHSGWLLDEEASRSIIKKALDMGINFFDTANTYAAGTSEEYLGRAIRDFADREEIVIATKVFLVTANMRVEIPLAYPGKLSLIRLMLA